MRILGGLMEKYKFAIISPHLDDGILSCGEFIKKVVEEGHDVTVITVFTGYPAASELSNAAKTYHSNCFLSDDSMEFRKIEDENACKFLGCKFIHLPYLECLYRKNHLGKFIYSDLSNIYYLDNQDQDIFDLLSIHLQNIVEKYDYILAPIGLGKHADHLLLNKVMRGIGKTCNKNILFYEEIPYLCYLQSKGTEVCIPDMKPYVVDILKHQWWAKVQAILYYRSQLHIMWKNENERIYQLQCASSIYGSAHKIRFWSQEDQ